MSSTESGEFVFYAYRPSLPAAVIFTVLFFASAGWHSYQLFRHRTWYFIPFVLGCLCTSSPQPLPRKRKDPEVGTELTMRSRGGRLHREMPLVG